MCALSQMTSAPAKLRNSFARIIVGRAGPYGAHDARATACHACTRVSNTGELSQAASSFSPVILPTGNAKHT